MGFASPTLASHGKGSSKRGPTTSPAPTMTPTIAPTYSPTTNSTNSKKSSKKSGGMTRTTSSVSELETENANDSAAFILAQQMTLTLAVGVSFLLYIY